MSKTIYKYELQLGHNELRLPVTARFLHAAVQGGTYQSWFEVDTSLPSHTDRTFHIYGTEAIVSGCHLATFFEGPFVWHLYEVAPF